MVMVLLLLQVGLIANVELHFFFICPWKTIIFGSNSLLCIVIFPFFITDSSVYIPKCAYYYMLIFVHPWFK